MKKAFAQTVRDIKREVNKKVLKVPSIEQKEMTAAKGILTLVRGRCVTTTACSALHIATKSYGKIAISSYPSRSFSAMASKPPRVKRQEGDEVTSVEDPFDAPTYNIPEKPVTFVEGASYSIFILAGLGVAAAAAYAVFKELIFEPKEYKIFGKALERVQNDVQVKVRIGSPVKGYGQESQNRAARQRIPNRIWKDEEGVEHVQVHFHIRGSNGGGKVYAEMFKNPDNKQWKFTYLIVDILSPSPTKLMLESYIPS